MLRDRTDIIDLARYRAALLTAEAPAKTTPARTLRFGTPSPVGFAFLDLPSQHDLPGFTRGGFTNMEIHGA